MPCVFLGSWLFCGYRFILVVGLEVRPDLVLVARVCAGFWFDWARLLVFFLGVVLFLVVLVVWLFFLVVVFVGVLFVCVGGSHIMHFHCSFGLFVWFWNSVGVRFVHFMCVHFLQLEHSIDC